MEKTRRKKIKFQKVFIVFLLVFIIFAFFNNLYRSQFQGKYKILDQTILFEKSIPCSGFLIFDEEIFNLPEETVNNLEEVSGRNNKGYNNLFYIRLSHDGYTFLLRSQHNTQVRLTDLLFPYCLFFLLPF